MMLAHALTTVRLLLVVPVLYLLGKQCSGNLLLLLVCVAIATDLLDGPVARARGTASVAGQRYDHLTDLVFVFATLMVSGLTGQITPLLAPLVLLAFLQYWFDSRYLHRQKSLRMSQLGRWNGVFYFLPTLLLALSLASGLESIREGLQSAAGFLAWLLVISTLLSMLDRALAKPLPRDSSVSG